MKELQPHQQRVLDEKNELFDKIQKLESFIETSSIFSQLSSIDKDDFIEQLRYMKAYLTILKRRINRF